MKHNGHSIPLINASFIPLSLPHKNAKKSTEMVVFVILPLQIFLFFNVF